MTDYKKINLARLGSAHADLQAIFAVIACTFDHLIICSHRTEPEQDKVFSEGKSKVQWPNSKHNSLPSMAVDAIPAPVDWSDLDRIRYFAGQVMGVAASLKNDGLINHRLRWGGDWDQDTLTNDQQFNDLVHFELVVED